MKMRLKSIISIIAFIPIVIYLLSGCMSSAKIHIIEPGLLTLPKDIDTIAIANRFLSNNNYNLTNYSPNSAFGNEYYFNKEASDSCVSSLFHHLGNSPRLREIDIKQELYRTGNDFFAPPLSPSEIIEMCKENKLQAMVILDGFHTNSSTYTQMHSKQVSYRTSYVVNGQTYYRTNYRTEYYYTANLNVFYSIGYRLYHGLDGSIIDEYRYDNNLSYSSTSSTSYGAMNLLPNKNRVIAKIAGVSGEVYAHRISPMWTNVKRSYFSGHGKIMAKAHQCVNQKNWEEAKNIWLNLFYKTKSRNTKGMIAYNIAVAYEMNDDLDSALVWITKSKNAFAVKGISNHINRADKYMMLLNNRMNKRQTLIDQMTK